MKQIRSPLLAGLFIVLFMTPLPVKGQNANDFRQKLEADGFEVQDAILERVDIAALYCAGLVEDANYNNPAPYASYRIPDAPAQTTQDLVPWTFRLRPDEAIVMINKTPPACRYFSYQTFVHNRQRPQGGRNRIFTYIGDAINLKTIRTSGNTGNAADGVFGQWSILIHTADQGVAGKIRNALVASGYDPEIINVEMFDRNTLEMGIGENGDEFLTLNRMALWHDEKAGKAYLDQPMEQDGLVYRVTPKIAPAPQPYTAPPLRQRGTGNSEEDLLPALKALESAVITQYSGYQYEKLRVYRWFPLGSECMQNGKWCFGATRDTVYLRTNNVHLRDTAGEFIVVFGINHAATGKAVYTNVNAYSDLKRMGVGGANDKDYEGTAQTYLPDHPEAEKLWVYTFSRNCTGRDHCFEIGPGCMPPGIGLDEPTFIGVRAYCEPDTAVGPSYQELVFPMAIHFFLSGTAADQTSSYGCFINSLRP